MLAPVDEITAGRFAWERLRRDGQTTWQDWILVGHALQAGRFLSMRTACVNQAVGQKYNHAMSVWLRETGFAAITQATRSDLFRCIENLIEIQKWRETLDEDDRLNCNHPQSVMRRWRRVVRESASASAQRRCIEHRPQQANAPTAFARAGRPGGDMIKRVATALRAGWTTDTFRLACIAIEAVARDPDLAALLAPKTRPAPKPRPHAAAELRA
jgi:hypothetical protein